MVRKTTVDSWGISCAGYECDSTGNVTLLWCKVCREFYLSQGENALKKTSSLQGVADDVADKFIRGTKTIKKCNLKDHVAKSLTHKTAVMRLAEARKQSENQVLPSSSSSSTSSSVTGLSGVPRQATLLTHFQKLNAQHRNQLTKKFQLAHFLAAQGRPFKLYEDFAKFEKDIHKVDLGSSYTSDTSAAEIVRYLSKSNLIKNITEPINSNAVKYFSVMNDGSSSAKTMDEKELFLMKTAAEGYPKYTVMSLEEPENAHAEGLKKAMENSFEKLNLVLPRKNKELGMCTDGASVNVALHRLVKEEMGEHYLLVLCPSHKVELALKDAFKESTLNDRCEEDLRNTYYLFKKANLRWRLFKRQSRFMAHSYIRYKRPAGTRWTEHQVDALTSYNHNLPVFIAFANQQISEPYNKTMKDVGTKLQGMLKNVTQMNRVVYNSIKQDILMVIRPTTKVLQRCDLLLPELITVCSTTVKTVKKLRKLVDEEKGDAFKRQELFPSCCSILDKITVEEKEVVPPRQTRFDVATTSTTRNNFSYYGYLLKGSLEHALKECSEEFIPILSKLETSLAIRLGSLTEEPIFKAMAQFLDTKTYHTSDVNEIKEQVSLIKTYFETVLLANGCLIDQCETEMEIVYEHVLTFSPQKCPSKCWPALFLIKEELGIQNILHIAELCIAVPISNAESERVFSFLWRVFSKERQSQENSTLENILRLRCDNNFSEERYKHAIDLFLREYPSGEVRKRSRRLDGHVYPKRVCKKRNASDNGASKKVTEVIDELVPSSESESSEGEEATIHDINIQDISDDEWSIDSEEEC